jgi:hypothetical protein
MALAAQAVLNRRLPWPALLITLTLAGCVSAPPQREPVPSPSPPAPAAPAQGSSLPPPQPLPYLQAKVTCSEAAVWVTQELMTMFGGTAFAARLPFERYFRDARAGMIMGLANDEAYPMITNMLFPPQR